MSQLVNFTEASTGLSIAVNMDNVLWLEDHSTTTNFVFPLLTPTGPVSVGVQGGLEATYQAIAEQSEDEAPMPRRLDSDKPVSLPFPPKDQT